jgi:hypothetical protein
VVTRSADDEYGGGATVETVELVDTQEYAEEEAAWDADGFHEPVIEKEE